MTNTGFDNSNKEENKNGLFITNEALLIENSWRLLLRKSATLTALDKYKRTQEEILKEIFEE